MNSPQEQSPPAESHLLPDVPPVDDEPEDDTRAPRNRQSAELAARQEAARIRRENRRS